MQNLPINKIRTLLSKYDEGKTSLEEEKLLEQFFSEEEVPEDLQAYADEFAYYREMSNQQSETDGLMELPQSEKKEHVYNISHWPVLFRAAAVVLLVAFSFAAGYFVNKENGVKDELAALKSEVIDLKYTTVNMLLQQESSHERIEALVLAGRMEQIDDHLLNTVIEVLNKDDSQLVRSMALEFLEAHKDDHAVRSELVPSLLAQRLPSLQWELFRIIMGMEDETLNEELKKAGASGSIPQELKEEIEKLN